MELYVHIPFCIKKCRYCSFVSYAAEETEHEKYINLLLKEAALRHNEAEENLRTVYFGGGTPSLLSPVLFNRLTEGLKDIWSFDSVEEFSTEANPGTVSGEWLDAALASGVNRLSLGMQAYQDNLLSVLGRIHCFQDVQSAVQMARGSGIENISLDLIFGIPGQRRKDWIETLDAALSLHPEHISAYGLIPEEGTPLYADLEHGKLSLPDPEDERIMYWDAVRILRKNGYQQYEISNFARAGYACRHNIGYWKQIPYIGLGVSAASMNQIRIEQRGISYIRRMNPSLQEEYEKMIENGFSDVSAESINPREARFETIMLGFRMNDGVSEADFSRMHGLSLDECFGLRLHCLEQKGLLKHEDGRWFLTERGFDIQNSVLVELMD